MELWAEAFLKTCVVHNAILTFRKLLDNC
jgi:hypothetical protein